MFIVNSNYIIVSSSGFKCIDSSQFNCIDSNGSIQFSSYFYS